MTTCKIFTTRLEAETFARAVDTALGYPKRGRFLDGTIAPRNVGETHRHDVVYRSATISTNARGEETYTWIDEWYYVVEGPVAAVSGALVNTALRDLRTQTRPDEESRR